MAGSTRHPVRPVGARLEGCLFIAMTWGFLEVATLRSNTATANGGSPMGDGKVPGKVLDIKTADIKAAAPAFHQGAIDLSKALTTLVNTLDGLGEPWGHDKQGNEFGKAYQPQQKKIESAAGVLVLGLTSIHEAMVDMADGHVDNDELIAGMFTAVKTDKQSDGAGER